MRMGNVGTELSSKDPQERGRQDSLCSEPVKACARVPHLLSYVTRVMLLGLETRYLPTSATNKDTHLSISLGKRRDGVAP